MPLRQAGIAAMLPLRELLHAVGALTGMMCRKAPFLHRPPKRRLEAFLYRNGVRLPVDNRWITLPNTLDSRSTDWVLL